MLTNKQIIELATHYENTHAVEDYRFYDWNVWPLIREETTLSAMSPSFSQGGTCKRYFNVLKSCLKQLPFLKSIVSVLIGVVTFPRKLRMTRSWQKDWQAVLECDPSHNDNYLASDRDVLVFTFSERRMQSDQGLYEIYSDPLVESLNKMGVTTLVWERGDERYPRYSPSAWVSQLLSREMEKLPDLPLLIEPLWFRDFASFTTSVLGRKKSWAEIESSIQYVQKLSIVFETWLKQTEVKLLISVGWYLPDVMALALAAKRLGILVVDLQHGIQGYGHDAYYGWEKTPDLGYELVPDIFLCWGTRQAEQVMEYNPAFAKHCKAITGGNLWLNKWRYSDCSLFNVSSELLAKQSAVYNKVILVSLHPGKELYEFVINALTLSPDEYYWLLRFHPGTSPHERFMIEGMLASLSCTNYEFELSSQIPLYALLQQSNLHITGHSTTALEALCFGLPTITVTKNGVSAYAEFIEAGTIFNVASVAELFQTITACETVTAQKCQESVQEYFAPQNIAEDGIHQILSAAGVNCIQVYIDK